MQIKSKIIKIELIPLTFYSELEENLFFEGYRRIDFIVDEEITGHGASHMIHIDTSKLTWFALLDLIGLFRRYKLETMPQLRQLEPYLKEDGRRCLTSKTAYWSKLIYPERYESPKEE